MNRRLLIRYEALVALGTALLALLNVVIYPRVTPPFLVAWTVLFFFYGQVLNPLTWFVVYKSLRGAPRESTNKKGYKLPSVDSVLGKLLIATFSTFLIAIFFGVFFAWGIVDLILGALISFGAIFLHGGEDSESARDRIPARYSPRAHRDSDNDDL